MRNLPTMTVLAERSEHRNVQLCTQCLVCGGSLEAAQHLWECPVQSHEWQLARQRLHTWLSTYVGPQASPVQSQLWDPADECDRWLPLALEQGSDDEEEEIAVLEHRPLNPSPISVAPLPAPPEPMSGTRNRPMLVEESPAPHYIMVEDSPAPQYIVVEESLVPMSGVKNRPCLVVESSEPTEDRSSTTFPVHMSGTKDQPSLVDDSPAVPKVDNLCWGGDNPVAEG